MDILVIIEILVVILLVRNIVVAFTDPLFWVKLVINVAIMILVLMIPGWIQVFHGKNFSESWNLVTTQFTQTFKSAFNISLKFYTDQIGNIFKKQASNQIDNLTNSLTGNGN